MAKFDTAFCLAFDVEKKYPVNRSGFMPARRDLGADKELFGEIRLYGFASLARLGMAKKLVIVGGNEGRYKNETPPINRAWAIREMLIKDHCVPENMVEFIPSNSNTGGNLAAIWKVRKEGDLDIMVSNLYHLVRVSYDLSIADQHILCCPAEAFVLLEDEGKKASVITWLGGGPLAERIAEEAQGFAHKLKGIYQPRTDNPAK